MTHKNYADPDWLQRCAQAFQLLKKAEKVTFLTHFNPDEDGVSACAALSHIAQKMGKQVEAVYPSALKPTIKRQPANVRVASHTQIPDLVIMCDTANYARLYYPDVFKDIPAINIDHHVSNSLKATINLVMPDAASTCDMLYMIIKAWDPALVDAYVAEALLYGFLYDSQVFMLPSITADSLRIAADLVDAGAPLYELIRELLSNKNKAIIPFWGKLLSSVTFNAAGTAAWMVVKQADLKSAGLTLSSLIGLENFMPQIADIDVCMLFYEDENGKSKLSLRSKVTDVNAVASKFGGGGHRNASGVMSSLPIDELVKQVVAVIG